MEDWKLANRLYWSRFLFGSLFYRPWKDNKKSLFRNSNIGGKESEEMVRSIFAVMLMILLSRCFWAFNCPNLFVCTMFPVPRSRLSKSSFVDLHFSDTFRHFTLRQNWDCLTRFSVTKALKHFHTIKVVWQNLLLRE